MYLKKLVVYSLCFLCPTFFFGQIKISENIQSSQIANQTNNKLYFVDFWATWCVPCVHVSKYLESLQAQYPDDFYIVSLSQESPRVVKKFMTKHDIKLAVAIDFDGQTFKKNNIVSLPYGILYNAAGDKLWEGHPAELKSYQIANFLRSNNKKKHVDHMFEIETYEAATIEEAYVPTKNIECIELQEGGFEELVVNNKTSFTELKGSLQDILAYSLKVYKNQVKIPHTLNKTYQIYLKNNIDTIDILKALNLEQIENEIKGDVLVFDVKAPTFWDDKQIDWGIDSPHYLIGDSEIMGDNVTFNQMQYKLSNVLEMPVIVKNKPLDTILHDWQIHYKYFDLMASMLSDTYGVDVKKETTYYPQYVITKKTP
ncbi:TlpA family protein disulfide reductase [Thalassobellus sediminis]|uniref:TlpA family protein disulfide reductase n=1 Tax=Thalassobellus sediminis TaxID=3367753 RepID=UPI00378A10BF